MNELPVVNRSQELYGAVRPIINKLPSLEKQTIGRRVEDGILSLLESFIMAKHAPKAHKTVYLLRATAQIELLTFQLRLLLEQKLANETTTHQLQAKLVEIGRMCGGWLKSTQ
jgi:hypothetical protein